MNELWIVLGVILAGLFLAVGLFNGLVAGRNQVKNAWAQIDVQLKRRHDLIPNLVETAKGYMKHERETFESITRARSEAMSGHSVGEKAVAESKLSRAVGKFLVAVENYPDLKANQNFLTVQEELRATENKISFARQNYNDQVLFYNNKIQSFPSNVIAGVFSFKEEESFRLEDRTEAQVPKVQF